MIKRADIILIIVLLAAAAALFFAFDSSSDAGEQVIITGPQNEVKIDFRSLTEEKRIEIEVENGKVIIVVDSQGAQFVQSPCSGQQCVNMGKISKKGQYAVCVPCRVQIRISGGELDGVTE